MSSRSDDWLHERWGNDPEYELPNSADNERLDDISGGGDEITGRDIV